MQNECTNLVKLRTMDGKEWIDYLPTKGFCIEKISGGQRICATTSSGYIDLLLTLAAACSEPFFVLYVLILSRRSEHSAGRYQSPTVSRDELQAFFEKFEGYLEQDARHHIWIHSPASKSTLVYDKHQELFAYGSLEVFSTILLNNGYSLVETTRKLGPHQHNFHPEFDDCEANLLNYWQWKQSPLHPQDEA